MSQPNNIQDKTAPISSLQKEAKQLLEKLIAIPSFSKEEDKTADLIQNYLHQKKVKTERKKNNIWAINVHYDSTKPTLLLNSHHDTVRPNKGYTLDPFSASVVDDKLYGLGSNDAGGCLVSLMATFLYFYEQTNLSFNIVLLASAEEEISGIDGVESILPLLPKIDFGIVGEPTLLEMAIAERGLLVLDVVATGKAGHAARAEGENALYKILPDLTWIQHYQFEKVSDLLGAVTMNVTVIETDNKTHNIVPATCKMVVDVRVNELYSLEEVVSTISEHVQSTVTPRSVRLKSSAISMDHILVKAGLALGKGYYGSVTTSDKALMPFPTLKMGPGDSARSHTEDEFIYLKEIDEGISTYIQLIEKMISL